MPVTGHSQTHAMRDAKGEFRMRDQKRARARHRLSAGVRRLHPDPSHTGTSRIGLPPLVVPLRGGGGIAPGVVALICGVALVLGGVALIVVVMKALLRQATQQEVDLGVLRAELDEVV